MNLWATVAQSAVAAVVQITVGLYYRRLLRLRHDDVERILQLAETVAGITSSIPIIRPKERTMQWDQYRKAISAGVAAGVGLIFTGALTWATTDHLSALEQLLEPAVPEPVRPLLGVLVGGVVGGAAIVRAVYAAENAPKPGPLRGTAATIAAPALPTTPDDSLPAASSAGTAPVVAATAAPAVDVVDVAATTEQAPTTGPFWAGVSAGEPQAPTSKVQLPAWSAPGGYQ